MTNSQKRLNYLRKDRGAAARIKHLVKFKKRSLAKTFKKYELSAVCAKETKTSFSEIEAAIRHLPDISKDAVRTSSAAILHRARLPAHKNISKEERKALNDLKKDQSRVIMKADKGNCFVVMDRSDYDNKMETLLNDRSTYELVSTSPFRRIERESVRNLDVL